MYYLLLILLILISAPVFAAISLLLYISQGAPVIFCQKRIGKNGKSFTMYKFRTMRTGSEAEQKKLRHQNEAHGPVFKIHNDPRFTLIGRFLAHTGLDELPQLYNVLRGDMALIGPRPLPVLEVKKLKPWQLKRHHIKPGIMSPWILEGYHAQTFDAWMKSDIDYIKKKSVRYDAGLALQTVKLLTHLFCFELLGLS